MIANANPSSYNEAMEDKGNWQEAMESEMKALAENDTWELMLYTPGMRVLRGKWVYKIKRNLQGQIT